MKSRRMKVSDSHSIRLLLLPSPIVPRLFCLAHEHHLPHSPPLLTRGPNQWSHEHDRQVRDNASAGRL